MRRFFFFRLVEEWRWYLLNKNAFLPLCENGHYIGLCSPLGNAFILRNSLSKVFPRNCFIVQKIWFFTWLLLHISRAIMRTYLHMVWLVVCSIFFFCCRKKSRLEENEMILVINFGNVKSVWIFSVFFWFSIT